MPHYGLAGEPASGHDHASARKDIQDISDWYEGIRPELALRFRDDIDHVMEAIGQRPLVKTEAIKGTGPVATDNGIGASQPMLQRRLACIGGQIEQRTALPEQGVGDRARPHVEMTGWVEA